MAVYEPVIDVPDGQPNATVSFKVGTAGGLWAIVHNPDGSETSYRLVKPDLQSRKGK